MQAVNQVFASKSQFLDILNRNITIIINQADNTEIEVINQKLEQLQKELLKQATNNQDYSILADEIYRLRDKKEEVLSKNAGFTSQKERMAEMVKFLKEQKDLPMEYDEKIVRRLIEKVEIFDKNVRVIFKSGMKVEIDD